MTAFGRLDVTRSFPFSSVTPPSCGIDADVRCGPPCRPRDYYHTCYCLSGLSAAQRCHGESVEALPQPRHVLGPYSNLLVSGAKACGLAGTPPRKGLL